MKNDNKTKTEKTKKDTPKKKSHKGAIIGLTIATSILGATTAGFAIAYGVTQSQSNGYAVQLENIYEKNYYELVDGVNSADTKISKLLASSDSTYQTKMLNELSTQAKEMQSNVASLPLYNDAIVESVKFINQMSGYTQTLEEKLSKGETLSDVDLETLSNMHESLTEMKRYLNRMTENMMMGYSILNSSSNMYGEFDEFSLDFSQIKSSDADYPTMIYDGPFSDSVVNQKVKGLSEIEISKEDAYDKVDSIFTNISNLKYQGQTNGKFETYNYSLLTSDNQKLFVQVTKKGGNLLTVSGHTESDVQNISNEQAEKIALDFAEKNGVENGVAVWNEILNAQAYFNIAPKQDGVILYPDLVKVKVDMETGVVVGYDAMTYWTNHTDRNLSKATVSKEEAKSNVDDSFEVVGERLVLAPLDFNRQVLCHEFECERNGSTYYIYFNAESGIEENILKVVKTNDGSKLM